MKRRLQVLALFASALLAVHLMAQDNGGGGDASGAAGASNGASGSDISGASGSGSGMNGQNGAGGGNANGSSTGEGSLPGGNQGNENGGGTGVTPSSGDLFGPGTGTSEGGSTIIPAASPSPSPSAEGATPGATPTPTPSPTPTTLNGGTQGMLQAPPVTFELPGGYGGSAPVSFTLGKGRLAKPPITFSLSTSQGYDDNIYSSPSNYVTATPFPTPTPPLLKKLIGFRITPPSPPTPVFKTFRAKVSPTPTAPGPLGVVGSPVSSASLGIQIQQGSPRTVLTLDASVGLQDQWIAKSGQTSYTGNFDTSFQHRLSSRATLSINASAVYQESPNFALENAPTANQSNGSYLNGTGKIDLSYAWSKRVSTVTSYNLAVNLPQSNANQDLYESTYGTQFRYTVSARNTITAELRQTQGVYPSDSALNATYTYYLLGLDTIFSARLRNTFSMGIESTTGNKPYFESATTLALPRGAGLTWTNHYGAEEVQIAGQSITSYRTGLSYGQPLSTKLSASVSVSYNNLDATDSLNPGGAYTQNQFQISLSLGYTVTPRFSLSLSGNYYDLLSSQVNGSYQRNQINLGGSYTFE